MPPIIDSAKGDAAPYQYGQATLFGGNLVHRPDFHFEVVPAASRHSVAQAPLSGKPANAGFRPPPPQVTSGTKFVLNGVESCTWDDVNALTTGTITTRVQEWDENSYELQQGDMVFCYANIFGVGTLEIWRMRVYKPQLTGSNNQRTCDLKNDLELLRMSEDNWLFTSTINSSGIQQVSGISAIPGGKPGGWLGRDIIKEVGRRYGFPVYVKGMDTTKRATLLKRRASPLEIIRNQLVWERRKTQIRYVFSYVKGWLVVTPLVRSEALRVLGPSLIEAAFSSELYPEFSSALTLYALDHTDQPADTVLNKSTPMRSAKGTHVYQVSKESLEHYGYVHKIRWSPDAFTQGMLSEEAKAYLEGIAKPLRKLTLTAPGIPTIKRGDAIQLAIGDAGLYKQIVFVDQASHSLTPSGHVMTLQLIFDDPYIDRLTQNIIWLLKGTQEQAIGNRDPLNLDGTTPTKQDGGKATPEEPYQTISPVGLPF